MYASVDTLRPVLAVDDVEGPMVLARSRVDVVVFLAGGSRFFHLEGQHHFVAVVDGFDASFVDVLGGDVERDGARVHETLGFPSELQPFNALFDERTLVSQNGRRVEAHRSRFFNCDVGAECRHAGQGIDEAEAHHRMKNGFAVLLEFAEAQLNQTVLHLALESPAVAAPVERLVGRGFCTMTLSTTP